MLYNHLKPYRPWINPKNMSVERAKCDDGYKVEWLNVEFSFLETSNCALN
jgi:hypothetical protein